MANKQVGAYLGSVAGYFDDDGKLINKDCQKFLTSFMEAYKNWVEKLL